MSSGDAFELLQDQLRQTEWLDPWEPVEVDRRAGFEDELRRELCGEHVLYGRSLVAVGRRVDCDDVLFIIDDRENPLVVVHLTWSQATELYPEFPGTQLFKSLEDWVDSCMMPNHQDLA